MTNTPNPQGNILDEKRELLCERCACDYNTWFAPDPLWNKVMRHPDGREASERYQFCCPRCFTYIAEKLGVCGIWKLDLETSTNPQANTPKGVGRIEPPLSLEKLLTIKIANLMIGNPCPNVGQIIEAISPTIQAHTTEARVEQKIDTLKTTHGHQQTGTILNDKYFIHNITMLEKELYKSDAENVRKFKVPEYPLPNFAKQLPAILKENK